ncbi:hypothetical protein [Saccharibacillus alkalitolerans]|uniref:Uncharacterized protein n=1 Tax=Saccharibacillus alkalitolerans TaxID=2705290 RepID=A0ABX0FB47_9BACL|nr:hypothetical protein [Saccharibacillus alkalitolerans]NGZ77190.1 hypothetical protein [Saccharibacillus alkalitolerans]
MYILNEIVENSDALKPGGTNPMKKMRFEQKSLLFMAFFTLALLFGGCTMPNRISSDQIEAFDKQIQKDHPAVENVEFEFVPTRIRMSYVLEERLGEEEKKEIFEQSRDLLMSDTFFEEIVHDRFMKTYPDSGYPAFIILLQEKDSDSLSRFEIRAEDSEDAGSMYQQWYYSEDGSTDSEPFMEESSK